MELLERYLNEVGKYLLKSDRKDIQDQVKSFVSDIVDKKKSEGIEEEEALRLSLIEMGSPEEVAHKYDARFGYLVGPKLFGIYKWVVGFSIMGISIGLVTSFIVQLSFNSDMEVGVSLWELLLQIVTGALSIIGSVTIVFYLIQRFLDTDEIETKEEWNPLKLPKLPEKAEKINVMGEITAIVITIVIMFIFNLHPEIIGSFYSINGGPYIFESLFSVDQVSTYLMFLNPLWVIVICVHIYVLSRGKRTFLLKLISSFVTIGIFTTLWIMVGDIGLNENVGDWVEPLSSSLKMGFGVLLIILIVDIVRYLIVYKRNNDLN